MFRNVFPPLQLRGEDRGVVTGSQPGIMQAEAVPLELRGKTVLEKRLSRCRLSPCCPVLVDGQWCDDLVADPECRIRRWLMRLQKPPVDVVLVVHAPTSVAVQKLAFHDQTVSFTSKGTRLLCEVFRIAEDMKYLATWRKFGVQNRERDMVETMMYR